MCATGASNPKDGLAMVQMLLSSVNPLVFWVLGPSGLLADST